MKEVLKRFVHPSGVMFEVNLESTGELYGSPLNDSPRKTDIKRVNIVDFATPIDAPLAVDGSEYDLDTILGISMRNEKPDRIARAGKILMEIAEFAETV
jgi:hypothetical protein